MNFVDICIGCKYIETVTNIYEPHTENKWANTQFFYT